MKRALVFSALAPGTGCALRARYLSDALDRRGWQSECIVPPLPPLPFSLEVFLSAPYFAWVALTRSADLAAGIKPYPNVWLALWILKLKGAKAVADVDDLDGAWRGGLVGAIGSAVQAPAYVLLDHFSTHHPGIQERLCESARLPAEAWVTLAQGVDLGIFHPRPAKSEKLLLYTAHLNVACQLDLLVSCIAPWLKKHKDYRLIIAGGGPKLHEYQGRYRSGQIHFTGALAPEEVAAWVARAGACLSVYDDGAGNAFRVPMKLGEYLAMGKPVVTNLVSGAAALKGFVYECQPSSAGFSAALSLALKGRDGRAKRGASWVRRHLSWDKVAGDYLKALG